jgi:hypothetical protein
MKSYLSYLVMLLVPVSFVARGQGTFVYDQQSSTESLPGEAIVGITSFKQPVGQSFIPNLTAVGFIRLQLLDGIPRNGMGATILINLRTNSISGPIMASTVPVLVPDDPGNNTVNFTTFFFSTPVSVTPGTLYYFQPVIQSGDNFGGGRFVPNYPGGTEYINGQPGVNDLWFREGIVVPEPSSALLFLFGGGVLLYVCHAKNKKRFLG